MFRFPGTYRNKLAIVGAILLSLFVGVGVIDYKLNERYAFYQLRSHLAHQVHQDYLLLSKQTYALFKHLVDAAITSNRANEQAASDERQAISGTLDRIRLLIAEEVALVGDEVTREREELLLLARIERQLDKILSEFEEILRLMRAGHSLGAEAQMVLTLEQSIDEDFQPLLTQAIDDEAMESASAEYSARRLLGIQNRIVHTAAGTALVVSILMVIALRRDFRKRIAHLDDAIESLSRGNLSHRLPEDRLDEFGAISSGFNRMARDLEEKQRQLEDARDTLAHRVRDTTAELVEANAALHRLAQVRQQFFADISHELRTPVTVISGEAQFACRGDDRTAAEYREVLRHVYEQSLQLGRLVDDLLYIARSSTSLPKQQYRPVPMLPLVEGVCDDARSIAAQRNIEVGTGVSLPTARVMGDEGRIRQLLMILVDNGLNYSQPGGRVDILLGEQDSRVRIDVVDNGIGIPEDEQAQVMERFFRGRKAMSMNKAGSGLGLPVANAIVAAHDGEIRLSSRPGEGTRVTVLLPAIPALKSA